jgi:primary-amine oxidase
MLNEAHRRPLDPLSAQEVVTAVRIFRTQGPASDNMRFVSINLHEPAKTEFESVNTGNNIPDRCALIIVLDLALHRVLEVIVSLRDEALQSYEEHRGVQPGIII